MREKGLLFSQVCISVDFLPVSMPGTYLSVIRSGSSSSVIPIRSPGEKKGLRLYMIRASYN